MERHDIGPAFRRTWIRRTAGLATLGLAAAFAAPAWPALAQGKPVVIASPEDVTSLDPHMLDSNHPTGSAIWSIFDSLVRRAPDGSSVPRLAESWERTNDLTWRFKLRRGVKFHNGEDFDAQAVKV